MSKDLWFAEMERLMSEGASYERACDLAHGSMMERLCDLADNMRKRAREEGVAPTQSHQERSDDAPAIKPRRFNAPKRVP